MNISVCPAAMERPGRWHLPNVQKLHPRCYQDLQVLKQDLLHYNPVSETNQCGVLLIGVSKNLHKKCKTETKNSCQKNELKHHR